MGGSTLVTEDASKRSIILHHKNNRFCSEPSPDAMGTLATQLAAALSGKAQHPSGISGEVDSTISHSLRYQCNRLVLNGHRAVQVLRDGMYRLCEAFLNEAIDQDTYADQMVSLVTTLNYVVPIELCINSLDANTVTEKETSSVIRSCIEATYQFALGLHDHSTGIRKAKYQYERAKQATVVQALVKH